MGMSGYQPGPCLCQHPPRLNKIPTSLFGDQFKGRRRRKIQPHKRKPKPPSSATQSEGRRRRTLYTPKKDSQPPPSAIHGPLAENGGYSPLKGDPNLRHRRPIRRSPNTEDTHTEKDSLTSVIGETIKESPNTDVTHPKNGFQTSIFGDPRNTRRKRRIRPQDESLTCRANSATWCGIMKKPREPGAEA